jgi:hypothetical protein
MVDVVVNKASAWSRGWRPSDVEALELLAWVAMRDDRPVYVNHALFGAKLRGRRWVLAMLAQNPIPDRHMREQERVRAARWHLVEVRDLSWSGPVKVFHHLPGRQEIEYFLNGWNWPDGTWVSLTEGVRPRAWNEILGAAPPPKMERPKKLLPK